MTNQQKSIRNVIILLGLAVFALMIIPNNTGAHNPQILAAVSQDEGFQYPFLIRILTPAESWLDTIKHFFAYQHYIYGFPFYVVSTIVALPFQWIFQSELGSHTQSLLLALRQFVSVLPMICSVILLVYLQTRFQSWFRSIFLFLFLIALPGITRQNMLWWHPDALAILFAILTFFFLDRDQMRFDIDFYIAAIFCGLSTGTKLIGVFFFLAVPIYLFLGWKNRHIPFKKIMVSALSFVFIMSLTLVVSNPMLLVSETRSQILSIHFSHNDSFTHGWIDSAEYQQGPLSWFPVLNRWYGNVMILLFSFCSLVTAAFLGKNKLINKLILAWVLPLSLYLFFYIAVRPDHYWMPVMLPLFSGILTFTELPGDYRHILKDPVNSFNFPLGLALMTIILLSGQLFNNLKTDINLFQRTLIQEKLLFTCDIEPRNQIDGNKVELETDTWFSIEEFDNTKIPPTRSFTTQKGPIIIQANNNKGKLAWRCTSYESALLRSNTYAHDYKLSHPATIVFGPDKKELFQ